MSGSLSANTQAILLLTAPLLAGHNGPSRDALGQREYKLLARLLRDRGRQPADLLATGADELLEDCRTVVDPDRLARLLGRGFLLSQAVDRWQSRAMWVMSRADADYPRRLKDRLREDAPPVLYGCGDRSILDSGGLAVVGSRNVDDALVKYTRAVGNLAARASQTLVSGGARGIDQAAMGGALEAGGRVAGVLSANLERAALRREHRAPLMDGELVLVSPFDPNAGFNVGNAMRRNKLIYALAEAALVVSSDLEQGGTWTGAIEQLGKLHLVPVFVRSSGETSKGLEALRRKGAFAWPDPRTPEGLTDAIREGGAAHQVNRQPLLGSLGMSPVHAPQDPSVSVLHEPPSGAISSRSPADELFSKVTELLATVEGVRSDADVARELGVSQTQARQWLHRLVAEGILERLERPVRYRAARSQPSMFGDA